MAEKDKDSGGATAPTPKDVAQATAGPQVVYIREAAPKSLTVEELGRPKGWKHDRTEHPGGRFIVEGKAVDANGGDHPQKATREEVVDWYEQQGRTPPAEEPEAKAKP